MSVNKLWANKWLPITQESKMNKADLVDQVARHAKLSQSNSKKVVNTFFEIIIQSLQQGQKAVFTRFGKFSVAEKAARDGRNPKTGEALKIQAGKQPKFKPSKVLRDAVIKNVIIK